MTGRGLGGGGEGLALGLGEGLGLGLGLGLGEGLGLGLVTTGGVAWQATASGQSHQPCFSLKRSPPGHCFQAATLPHS